jgi:hypothetical protein
VFFSALRALGFFEGPHLGATHFVERILTSRWT